MQSWCSHDANTAYGRATAPLRPFQPAGDRGTIRLWRPSSLTFRVLGPLEVRAGERLLTLNAAKQKTILALLVLHRGDVVSVDRLMEALWGERPPVSAPTALQGYVSQLRRLLESGEDGGASLLLTRPPGYLLDLEPEQVDLARFERLTGSGREALARSEASRAATLLAEALALGTARRCRVRL